MRIGIVVLSAEGNDAGEEFYWEGVYTGGTVGKHQRELEDVEIVSRISNLA